MFFGQLTFVYKWFFSNPESKLFEVLSLDGILFFFQMVRTGLCNLVQKQPSNGLLTRGLPREVCSSSTMVQCTAMYSSQTCPTKNSFKVKLAKTDSAASCGTKDLNIP